MLKTRKKRICRRCRFSFFVQNRAIAQRLKQYLPGQYPREFTDECTKRPKILCQRPGIVLVDTELE